MSNKKKKTLIVSFSGVDGCGKSTQIELLKKHLESQRMKYKYFHLFSANNSFSGNLQTKKVFSNLVKKIRNLKNNKFGTLIKISSRLTNLISDSWITMIINSIKHKNQIIIYDRYFYDILIILIYDFPKYEDFLFKFRYFIPTPKKVFVFNADPETVIKRKKEHDWDSANKYCKLYRKFAKLKKIRMIDSNLDIESIFKKIKLSIRGL